MELAVVGSSKFVDGFRLAGVRKTYPVAGDAMEQKIAEVLEDKDVGILVLHNENMMSLPVSLRRRLSESVSPVVIPIGKEEEIDLRERIKQAVGVDLWKK
jgi:V/A-type H+-transporting ATPase subunit F